MEDRILDVYHLISIGWYAGDRFYHSRPRRKCLIHDLAFIPDDVFIRTFHKFGDGCRADYVPLIVSVLGLDNFVFLSEAFFSMLSAKFSKDERVSLYRSISSSMARWSVDSNISLVLDLARKILLEGVQ